MVIHASGLNITEVFMATFDDMVFGSVVMIEQVVEDTKEQLLRIYPRQQILPGTGLRSQISGFLRVLELKISK